MEKTKKSTTLYSLLIVILLFLAIALYQNAQKDTAKQKERICVDMQSELAENAFSSVRQNLIGKAAYVYDFSTGSALYGYNERLPLPLASLTKLMTIRVTLQTVSPDQTYTITPADIVPDGLTGFVPGDIYTVRNIIQDALIASSNNAATALANSTGIPLKEFLSKMNSEANLLGLPTLNYDSVTGLDKDNGAASAFGSARDIVQLLYKDDQDFPDLFAASTKSSAMIQATNKRWISLTNTDLAIPKLQLLVASKTGYTDAAGGNLAILWREPGGDLLGASILGSTEDGRFTDMVALHNAADLYVSSLRVIPKTCQ